MPKEQEIAGQLNGHTLKPRTEGNYVARTPTNTDLRQEIKGVKKDVNSLKGDLMTFKDTVSSKLNELHDFMIVQKDRQGTRNGSGVTLPKEVLKILGYLALAIVLALGGKELLNPWLPIYLDYTD